MDTLLTLIGWILWSSLSTLIMMVLFFFVLISRLYRIIDLLESATEEHAQTDEE